MNTEELKRLWGSGNYVAYYLFCGQKWGEFNMEHLDPYGSFPVLIHKKHTHIAEAVANDSSVEVICTSHYGDDNKPMRYPEQGSWFKWYDEDYSYELKPKQCNGALNGCYVEASQEAEAELIKLGYTLISKGFKVTDFKNIIIKNNEYGFNNFSILDDYKQLHFNKETKEFSEVESATTGKSPKVEKVTRESIIKTIESIDYFGMNTDHKVEMTKEFILQLYDSQEFQIRELQEEVDKYKNLHSLAVNRYHSANGHIEKQRNEIKELQEKLSVYEDPYDLDEFTSCNVGNGVGYIDGHAWIGRVKADTKYKILVIEEK